MAVDCEAVSGQLQSAFGWPDPYHDPGVSEFGLTNSVFEVGDTFIEVVSPVTANTTAGRYLERRGGDGGYMAIFQVPDLADARRRVDELGVRVVWSVELADMATAHLHPRDVPGAIVSLDWASPEGSWRWAGPRWTARVPDQHGDGGIVAVTIETDEPDDAAARWAAVLAQRSEGAEVTLPGSQQCVRFVPLARGSVGGITSVMISGLGVAEPVTIAGVTFVDEEMR